MEKLLSVFDQSQTTEDHHILNINDKDYPEKYRGLIRRLQKAISKPKIRDTMDIEDEVLGELEDMERVIEKKDTIINEKDKVIDKKDMVIDEKDKVIDELKRKLRLKK